MVVPKPFPIKLQQTVAREGCGGGGVWTLNVAHFVAPAREGGGGKQMSEIAHLLHVARERVEGVSENRNLHILLHVAWDGRGCI